MAFAMAHLIVFGNFMPEYRYFLQLAYATSFSPISSRYRGFRESFVTLLRASLGDVDFASMNEHNRVVAPILYLVTTIFMSLVMLNILVAQMADSYSAISAAAKKEFACDQVRDESYFLPLIDCTVPSVLDGIAKG